MERGGGRAGGGGGEGEGGASPRGVEKVNFKVMQIVMQRKSVSCARRGAQLGEAGREAGSLGRGWRGSCAGRELPGRAGGRAGGRAEGSRRRGLQGCFRSGSPGGMQTARRERAWQLRHSPHVA